MIILKLPYDRDDYLAVDTDKTLFFRNSGCHLMEYPSVAKEKALLLALWPTIIACINGRVLFLALNSTMKFAPGPPVSSSLSTT